MRIISFGILLALLFLFLLADSHGNGLTPVTDAYAKSLTGAQFPDCSEYVEDESCVNDFCKDMCDVMEYCPNSITYTSPTAGAPGPFLYYEELILETVSNCQTTCGKSCGGSTLIANRSIPCDTE